jgi:hypothetical protein
MALVQLFCSIVDVKFLYLAVACTTYNITQGIQKILIQGMTLDQEKTHKTDKSSALVATLINLEFWTVQTL